MMASPVIEIASTVDTITFYGDDIAGGWVYDNDALDSWLALAEVEVKLNKRPNSHGTYFPDQLFTGEHRFTLPGKYFGASALDAAIARNRLTALFNDGRAVAVTVTDDLGVTSRRGLVIDVDPEWMPDGHFTFTITVAAPDPRRYGVLEESSTGLPTASSGLVWPLGTGASFWDWGTPGETGRLTFTNLGNTTTFPLLEVGEGGTLDGGFSIIEVETGRELIYPVTVSDVIRLDNRTQRATLNGGDVTGNLTRREWFEVPPNEARSYQFATLGPTTGSPTFRLLVANAYL